MPTAEKTGFTVRRQVVARHRDGSAVSGSTSDWFEATEASETVAETVAMVRACQSAGWTAYVYGRADVRDASGAVVASFVVEVA